VVLNQHLKILIARNGSQLFIITLCTGPLVAVTKFDQGGVVGTITFTRLDNGSTQIDTSFSSGIFSGWHVHEFPVDYTDDPATRCGSAGTGPHYDPTGRNARAVNNGQDYSTVCSGNINLCEAGDLSGKFGPLQQGEFSFIDSDSELQLSGRYGIIGRSVVIHKAGGARIACANIILQNDLSSQPVSRLFVATFLGPVAGSMYFRQYETESASSTFIHAKLFYTDGTAMNTNGHLWGIHSNELVSTTETLLV